MMRFELSPKPPCFDEEVRAPGDAWLRANPQARSGQFPDYWTRVLPDLRAGFRDLCGYSAMLTMRATVDHYLSRSSEEGRALAYEWTNYRLADHYVNTLKGTWDRRILDPFEVGDDWFEVLLPNLEMILVEERIPPTRLADARFTLRQLGLRDGEDILELRRAWYGQLIDGDVTLTWLSRHAPLIARAVKRRLAEIKPADLDDEQTHLRRFLEGETVLKALRRDAPRLAEVIEAALSR